MTGLWGNKVQQIIGKVSGLFRAQPRPTAFETGALELSIRDLINTADAREARDAHVVETSPTPSDEHDELRRRVETPPPVFERPAAKNEPAAPAILSGAALQRPGPAQVKPLVSAELLDAVGRENETLRHRCEEVVRKVEEAATLRQDLSVVFAHVDTILKDVERTKAALSQRSGAYVAEREMHNELKGRHRALTAEHERMREELHSTHGENQRHIDALADLEGRAAALQVALAEKTALAGELTRRANADRDQVAQMQSEVQAAREEVQRADELMFSMQADLSAARDHATLVEEDNKMLQTNLAESRQQIQRMTRSHDDMKGIFDAARQRIEELETALSIERSDHGKLRGMFQQENQSRRGDVSTLQTRIDTLTARVEASDRLLLEARGQLHNKIEELRKAERKAQEAQKFAAPLDNRVRTLEQENEELLARVAEIEASHGAVGAHAEGLSKSIRVKDKEMGAMRAKIESLSDRCQSEIMRAEAEREHFEQTVSRLNESLEKEKLERSLAEGALEAARKDRHGHHNGLSNLRGAQDVKPVLAQHEDEASAA